MHWFRFIEMDYSFLFADTELVGTFGTEFLAGFQQAGREIVVIRCVGEALGLEAKGPVLLVGLARLASVFSIEHVTGIELSAGLVGKYLKADAGGRRPDNGHGRAHFFRCSAVDMSMVVVI